MRRIGKNPQTEPKRFATLDQLREWLKANYPPKCIKEGEDLESAHRYAAKVQLAQLILRTTGDGDVF